jgi:AcrR family transcriptional regulator
MAAEKRPMHLADYREVQALSEDNRTVRTRSRIIDAFEHLSETGQSVTVSAIVRSAEISRASFYTHFGSLEDLALALQRRVIERLASWQLRAAHPGGESGPADHSETIATSFRRLLSYFEARRGLYAEILGGPAAARARDELIDAIAAAHDDLARHAGRPGSAAEHHLQSLQIAGALTTLITRWLRGELDVDEDAIIASHTALLPAWMTRDEA